LDPIVMSQLAGVMTIAGSLLLIYLKRIDLARAATGRASKGESLGAQVASVFSIKAGTPALGLFAIGLVLVIAPMIVPPGIPDNVEYRVKGAVRVWNAEDERAEIDVYRHFPPLKTTPAGSLPDDLRVSRQGAAFPRLTLLSATVVPRDVDLNDPRVVSYDHRNRVIEIRDPIVLTALGGQDVPGEPR
jgi:hypothetical protein